MLYGAEVVVCSQIDTKHINTYSVERAYSCRMFNLLVHHVTSRFEKVKHEILFNKIKYLAYLRKTDIYYSLFTLKISQSDYAQNFGVKEEMQLKTNQVFCTSCIIKEMCLQKP
jgi:hypothetical protein